VGALCLGIFQVLLLCLLRYYAICEQTPNGPWGTWVNLNDIVRSAYVPIYFQGHLPDIPYRHAIPCFESVFAILYPAPPRTIYLGISLLLYLQSHCQLSYEVHGNYMNISP
jgi:hypothetical protein